MKAAVSYQLSAFSHSSAWQGVGCALRTRIFFGNRQGRRLPKVKIHRERRFGGSA